MAPLTLLPDPTQLELTGLTIDPLTQQIIATAATMVAEAVCPLCQQPSRRIHSHYTRRLTDLPMCGQQVRWLVEVRRFRCLNSGCVRKIFTERLPTCAPAYARRTLRLGKVLVALAFALGGRAGARLTQDLQMSVSHDTLIRLLRRHPGPSPQRVRILGVDDWSYRRGKRFGTILVE